MRKPREDLMSKFVSNLQSQAIPDVFHEMFKGCQHKSILYGIRVEHTHAVGTVSRLVLKWNSVDMRHESKSHYICASQYSRFEFRDRNQNSLIASKCVASLVPELGCMQGTGAAWLCELKGHSVNVTALDSSSSSDVEEENVTVFDKQPTVSLPIKDSKASAYSQKGNISEERETALRAQRIWKPCLSETLKYELWLSLESVEYNYQTLWHYIAEHQSDLSSFESKMEARLQSLCHYHADLYRDTKFIEIGTTLIKSAKDIQKGSNVTPLQKTLLLQFFNEYGWFLTPVLWNRAELLFLLVFVFDPRLLFVEVIQKDVESQIDKRQNRGIALCSNFLSGVLLQRLSEFDLLNCSHPSGEAIVLDSNGSYLQYFQAQRTIDCFKAMSPLKVISVSNAPALLSCNGSYSQISEHLYAQNVAYPQNGDRPEPRIIQVTEGRWCFKHLLAHGVDCWLMRQAESDFRRHPEDVQRWHAWTGCEGDSACSVCITEKSSDNAFEFDFGSGGGYLRIEHDSQDSVFLPQKRPAGRDADRDPPDIDAHRKIVSDTSFSPVVNSTMSVFDKPLCALFCLMFGTSLSLSDCSMQIPIGACIMSNFLVPHRDPFCFINRRALQFFILNQDFSKIPDQNVERRFRVLSCLKQRQAHGRVDFYDLSLLHDLSTFNISPEIRLCPLGRSHIVFRNDSVYFGDVNLDNEPNGFGSMCFRSELIQCGFFKDGVFIRACDSADSAVVATRHVNTLFMLLQPACRSNASFVFAGDTIVETTFQSSLDALEQYLHHISFTVLQNLYDKANSLRNSSRHSNSLLLMVQTFLQRLVSLKSSLSGCHPSDIVHIDDNHFEAADTANAKSYGESPFLSPLASNQVVGVFKRNSEDNLVAEVPIQRVIRDSDDDDDDDIPVSRNANAALLPLPQSKMPQLLDDNIVLLQTTSATVPAAAPATVSASVFAPADVTINAFDIVEAKFRCDLPAMFLSFDSGGNLAVSCTSLKDKAGKIEVRTFQNNQIISTFPFNNPFGFTFCTPNRLIVADSFSHCVRIFDCSTGQSLSTIRCNTGSHRFKPVSVAVDAEGNIVVFCYLPNKMSCLQVFSIETVFIRRVGSMLLSGGGTVAFDSDSNLVVSDNGGSRIRVFDYCSGDAIRTLSIPNRPDTAKKTLYMYCGGFVFDGSGHIFVANTLDCTVDICEYSKGLLLHRICFRDAPGSLADPGCLSVAMNDKEKMLIVCCGCFVYYYPIHLILGAGTGYPFTQTTTTVQAFAPDSSATHLRGNTGGNKQTDLAKTASVEGDVDISVNDYDQDCYEKGKIVHVHSSDAVSVQTSFIGLPNLGMTCGTNASLQCLLHTMELKNSLYGSNPTDSDHSILQVFKAMVNIGPRDCIKTILEVLRDCVQIGFPDQSNLPADSSEVLQYLLSHICPSRFRVTIKSQVSCLDCRAQAENSHDDYLTLPFPPPQSRVAATLEHALKLFQTEEFLEEDNRWFCPGCNQQTSSQKKLILDVLPNFFFIHLKRFESQGEKEAYRQKRINRIFEVPFEHHFGQLGVFRLYAAICHYPSGIGHFVAYCRPNPVDSWMRCDDSCVVAISDEKVLKDIKHNGYVFFYQRQPSASLNAIAQNITACRTLESGLSFFNQLSLIAKGYVTECKRVSSLCGSLQLMADRFIPTGEARRNFIKKCEELAQFCDDTAAAAQPPMPPGDRDDVAAQPVASVNDVDSLASAPVPAPAPAPALSDRGLPLLPDYPIKPLVVVRKAASAARVAHAFPYSFSSFQFDLSVIQVVNPQIASLLFKEFARVRANYDYVQYPDDHYKAGHDHYSCLHHRPAPCINNNLYVELATVDWFFQSLTTLFPDVMVLSPYLIGWDHQFDGHKYDAVWYQSFIQNVRDRRPQFVMHPLNLPEHLERPRHQKSNRDLHFVLSCIEFNWSHTPVSSKVSVLDPFSADQYINRVTKFYKDGQYFASFNPVFEDAHIDPIQLGPKNIHCGVYILALALNTVFRTLSSMGKRLNPKPDRNDTCDVGQLLRTCVAWDCTQFPSLLDTCLLMSPTFSPISCRLVAVSASAWWVQTPYHNIADSLAIKYGSIFIPVSSADGKFSEQHTTSSLHICRKNPGKISADGPLFFKNENLLVKVNCIGLIGHRLKGHHRAANRAASALHEASATQYYCEKRKWFCETFGLICVGLVCPCAFVCIVRRLGTAVETFNDFEVGKIFHSSSSLPLPSQTQLLSAPLRAFHGDPHRRNMVLIGSEIQLIDFERFVFIIGECPPLFLFTWYATCIAEKHRNQFHLRALMRIIKRSGLAATREFFSAFYENDTFLQREFNADLFEESPKSNWEYDAFLHLFQLIFEAHLEPKLISDVKIQCKLANDITIHAFDSPKPGNITVSCADGSLLNVLLDSESVTNWFFENFFKEAISSQQISMAPAPAPMPRLIPPHHCSNDEPAATCVGFWHLMGILRREALCHSDGTPQLVVSHDKRFISCFIRPVCCRSTFVPCRIFFDYTATGSIKIYSAEFEHQQHAFLVERFSRYENLFNLKDEAEAERFFDFALSMMPVYSSPSCGSGSDGDSNSDDGAKGYVAVYKPKAPASERCRPPAHQYLVAAMKKCGNPNVLQSIKESMIRRFGHAGQLKNLNLTNAKLSPKNALREEFFGCEIVLVSDESTRNRCIDFINSQNFLSLDTESTVPRGKHEGISLIQIGTSTNVFIVQVALQPESFFKLLVCSLMHKTLLCWGNDQTALQDFAKLDCTYIDVQHLYSSSSQKKGLADCIEELFAGKYVLKKDWRLSGWDNNPLTKGQTRYAALDVVACHVLYTALEFNPSSVYESDGDYITFYAYNHDTGCKVKHGFSFARDFLGHYINGSVSRGFLFSKSPPLLQGFRAIEGASHDLNFVDVQNFVRLLNEFKICCSLCSSVCVWKELGVVSTIAPSHSSVDRVSDNVEEQKAYYCASMLGSFLQLHPSKENLQCLKKSVCSDIYYGYIRETLAHVLP
jgi:ubiquitin C-terminal hydrolase